MNEFDSNSQTYNVSPCKIGRSPRASNKTYRWYSKLSLHSHTCCPSSRHRNIPLCHGYATTRQRAVYSCNDQRGRRFIKSLSLGVRTSQRYWTTKGDKSNMELQMKETSRWHLPKTQSKTVHPWQNAD